VFSRRQLLITDTLNVNIISSGQRMEIDRVNRYGIAAVTADCRNFIRDATFPAINANEWNGNREKEEQIVALSLRMPHWRNSDRLSESDHDLCDTISSK